MQAGNLKLSVSLETYSTQASNISGWVCSAGIWQLSQYLWHRVIPLLCLLMVLWPLQWPILVSLQRFGINSSIFMPFILHIFINNFLNMCPFVHASSLESQGHQRCRWNRRRFLGGAQSTESILQISTSSIMFWLLILLPLQHKSHQLLFVDTAELDFPNAEKAWQLVWFYTWGVQHEGHPHHP